MSAAAIWNIRDMERRADYNLPLQLFAEDDEPINLTGWTVKAQIWNEGRTVKYTDWSVTYINRTLGEIEIDLTASQTALLPIEAFYDVLLINPSGFREYYLKGKIEPDEGRTE